MATKSGMRIYRNRVELRSDGRRREQLLGQRPVIVKQPKRSTYRGKIAAWPEVSDCRPKSSLANAELYLAIAAPQSYRVVRPSAKRSLLDEPYAKPIEHGACWATGAASSPRPLSAGKEG